MTETRSRKKLAFGAVWFKALALVSFLLPWLSISVGSKEVVSATGLNLAMGEIAVRMPLLGEVEGQGGTPAVPLIAAATLIAFSLGASLVASRRGALAGMLLSGAALCLIVGFVAWGVYVHMPLPPEQMNSIERLADTITRHVVHVSSGRGFWLALATLVAGIVLDWGNLREDVAPHSK